MSARWLILLAFPAVAEAATWYRDADGDGYGNDSSTTQADTQPAGYAAQGGDCNDGNPAVNPVADEACDGVDNDCDGLRDADDPLDLQPWFIDDDGDGYGRPDANPYRGCSGPQGRVPNDDDCDDGDAAKAPGIGEICNDVDDDCDDAIDEDPALPFTFYRDADGDGFGSPSSGTVQGCEPTEGYVWDDGDCRDDSTIYHPRAFEACTPPLADTNCDGAFGGDVDNDHDGFVACQDCDDFDATIRPGAPDTWYDGFVQDCDRTSDFDRDLDGFDDLRFGGTDCNDDDASAHPGATDVPGDDVDQDCSGADAAGDTDAGDDGTDDVKVRNGCCEKADVADAGRTAWVGLPALLLALGLRRRRT